MAFRRRRTGADTSASEQPGLEQSDGDTTPTTVAETPDDELDSPSGSGSAADPTKKVRVPWTGRRLVALIAAVAVASLLLGIIVMQFIVSPATLAARTEAPEPGPVTAPVENKVLENTVVLRGEVGYADSVAVTIDAAGGESKAVVTGQVPAVGAVFNAGNVALEVAGRPVIVMPGELPAYRNLSIGMRGPDVTQLKQALSALGYATGDLNTDTFDWDTAAGLGALYEQLGYTAATGGAETQEMLRSAERAVRDANVSAAQAQATLDEARAAKSPSVAGEQAAATAAWEAVNDAQEALGEAQAAVLPTLPAGEALFLSGLPRRVDEVSVKRGDVLSGSPMSVSGATLSITGTVSKQDADLLSEGLVAQFSSPGGADLTAKVKAVTAPKSGGGNSENGEGGGGDAAGAARYTVELEPVDLSNEQIDELRGANVRLRIPVASTDGEVIAVPIAALSAGSGGEDRVELLIDVRDGHNAETETIVVEAGLAADGFVEITSDDERLTAGAKVVVGR
ncbi:peptidoglycan-binding protein [Leucobacter sp. G161]|uniref:peptidoglycan-binding domain-containing protein n=1 Tax=Leucobacter sp. G161 TaxID=663704 RepID=UPI000A6C0203|nr:peptidoglycan-binding protein [Leucobacter sp. G161]